MVQSLFSPRGAPFPLRPATFVGPWVLRSRPYHPRLVGGPLGRARLDYPQGGPGFLRVYYPNFFLEIPHAGGRGAYALCATSLLPLVI